MKWLLLLVAMLCGHPAIFANEQSVQWRYEPLKILHQVGKGKMTRAGIYRFPEPMYYTHPRNLLNSIAKDTTLAEFTDVEDREALPNVNLANLYGVKVSYDIVRDVAELDLRGVVRPEDERFSEDEVIRMTLECIRLNFKRGRLAIRTSEKTEKWKVYEEEFRAGPIRDPLYRPEVVPLAVDDTDLLYHWAYYAGDLADEQLEPTRFPVHGGVPQRFGGAKTAYRGIGFSLRLVIFPEGEKGVLAEMNQLVGYEFLLRDGILTIAAPTAADHVGPKFRRFPDAFARMQAAVDCARRSALTNGDEFTLRVVDRELTAEQRSAIESRWLADRGSGG